jgi:hypothetical protein
MAKFMILYNATRPAAEVMAETTPEQMQASMAEWIAWKEEAEKTVKFDFGLPLQAVAQVSAGSVADSHSNVSGYSIVESDSKDTVLELIKTHPHLKQDGNTIEVLQMLPIPGM